MRKLLASLVLALMVGSLASAQITVTATSESGNDQINDGTTTASVTQDVNLTLPPTVALHLDVSELNFDISKIGDYSDGTWTCVYGPGYRSTDLEAGAYDLTSGQTQVLPLGTFYEINGKWTGTDLTAANAPSIRIVYNIAAPTNLGDEYLVDSYPPRLIGEDGELIPGSKNHFVCYRTFILQKFSNYGSWNLTVTRLGDDQRTDNDSAFQLYIQDNSVCTINNHQGTGLFELKVGDSLRLLADDYTSGTTGSQAEACNPDGGKSWLDDLMIVAVKVDGETNGTNTTTLQYTITSPDPVTVD